MYHNPPKKTSFQLPPSAKQYRYSDIPVINGQSSLKASSKDGNSYNTNQTSASHHFSNGSTFKPTRNPRTRVCIDMYWYEIFFKALITQNLNFFYWMKHFSELGSKCSTWYKVLKFLLQKFKFYKWYSYSLVTYAKFITFGIKMFMAKLHFCVLVFFLPEVEYIFPV